MQMAVDEPHLGAQGEDGGRKRPEPERGAVHGQSKQGEKG